MAVDVAAPPPPATADFLPFDSAATSPYATAPSSPRNLRSRYASAPTSPTRIAAVYSPFPNSGDAATFDNAADDDTFEFNPSGQLDNDGALAAADELFEAGKIRPLNAPAFPSPSKPPARSSSASAVVVGTVAGKSAGSKKWSPRDLFLFRSATEGRAIRKCTAESSMVSPAVEDCKGWSFRSAESGGGCSMRKTASAHEVHYMENRMAEEEGRRKTPLGYRQGLFGCIRLSPAVNCISRGFGRG